MNTPDKEFEVKFSVFDKNLKVRVKVKDEVEAWDYIRNAIVIHSIQSVEPNPNNTNVPPPPQGGGLDDWTKYFQDLIDGFGKK